MLQFFPSLPSMLWGNPRSDLLGRMMMSLLALPGVVFLGIVLELDLELVEVVGCD